VTSARSGRTLGLLLGAVLDELVGDPRRAHPVAAFGRMAAMIEARTWADSRRRGAAFAAGLAGLAVAGGVAADRRARSARARVVVTAVTTWLVLGGATLAREGKTMARLLRGGGIDAARARLAHLCGRDPAGLDQDDLARATVESLAENTSDAVVAPLFWGAVAGAPAMLAYRVVNTLDAMIGHHSSRYERFGWAAARLDDLANFVPARITSVLAAALAPLVAGSPAEALRVLRRDGAAHPSPNAGRCEAAFAGALGVRLGGTNRYGDRVEVRGPLGDGRAPRMRDVDRTVRLSRGVSAMAVVLAAAAVWLRELRSGGAA